MMPVAVRVLVEAEMRAVLSGEAFVEEMRRLMESAFLPVPPLGVVPFAMEAFAEVALPEMALAVSPFAALVQEIENLCPRPLVMVKEAVTSVEEESAAAHLLALFVGEDLHLP